MFELLEIIFAPIQGNYVAAQFLEIAALVLGVINTYTAATREGYEEEEEGVSIPPASGLPSMGTGQLDMSELSQFRQQTPEYGAGGSAFGQAMAAFQPMRLGDIMRPQTGMGEDQFTLGRQRRRF